MMDDNEIINKGEVLETVVRGKESSKKYLNFFGSKFYIATTNYPKIESFYRLRFLGTGFNTKYAQKYTNKVRNIMTLICFVEILGFCYLGLWLPIVLSNYSASLSVRLLLITFSLSAIILYVYLKREYAKEELADRLLVRDIKKYLSKHWTKKDYSLSKEEQHLLKELIPFTSDISMLYGNDFCDLPNEAQKLSRSFFKNNQILEGLIDKQILVCIQDVQSNTNELYLMRWARDLFYLKPELLNE